MAPPTPLQDETLALARGADRAGARRSIRGGGGRPAPDGEVGRRAGLCANPDADGVRGQEKHGPPVA